MTPSDNCTAFRTVWHPKPSPVPMKPGCRMLTIGSCFADNIGAGLRRRMVDVVVNPCGSLFNPLSIKAAIECALSGKEPEYVECGGKWISWMLPTEFADADPQAARRKGQAAIMELRTRLLDADVLFVTFGTAIVYSLAAPPFTVVGNCHKQPAAMFFRDMLSTEHICRAWEPTMQMLKAMNPRLRVIFTVSPVRHLREGFHPNALSKATLMLAADAIAAATDNCEYFPAYEIMTDDLRDYRFYADDMQHPSPMASEYILNALIATYFSEVDQKVLDKALALRRRLDHRPLDPGSQADIEFRKTTDSLLRQFIEQNPGMKP